MENPIETTKSESALAPKQKFEGKVLKTSLQGVLIDIGHPLPAFLHISQVLNATKPDAPVKSIDDLIKIGDTVTVWVKRVMKDHTELTMHEPLLLDWKEIQPEMAVKGKIVRLETFGAFVEIGAERPGLVHVSELSHSYVKVPSEVVKVGDEVDVKVLEVDRKKKQIKLSMKALQAEPEVTEEDKKPARKPKVAKKEAVVEEVKEVIPDPTYMEIALRQAMEQAERRKPAARSKKSRSYDSDADDIYERTMKNKINDKD